MSETYDPVVLMLDDKAQEAVSKIARMLGDKTTEAEVVQRALGTELYLLQQVTNGGAKVVLQFKNGLSTEIDLFG